MILSFVLLLKAALRRTDNHEVELKALLHGLPPHLLQDGVNAHVAEFAAMAFVPLHLQVGVAGFARLGHVAVAQTDL